MLLQRMTVALVVLTAGSVMPAHVSAQTETPASVAERRPYRGLFGGPPSPDSPHSLVFTGSAYVAYDDNVTEAISEGGVSTTSPWLQKSGTYRGADAGLDYAFSFDRERYDFRGAVGGQLRYYHHDEGSDVRPAAQADVALNVRLTKSLTLNVRQGVDYTSNYNGAVNSWLQDDPGLDIGIPDDPALDLFELRALQFATKVELDQRIGRYTSLTGGYYFRSTNTFETEVPDANLQDYSTHAASAGVEYARPFTRYATAVLGYRIRVSDGQSPTGEPEIMHHIDAGVDYGRALSFSRRTSFEFGTGSAIVVSDEVNRPGEQESQVHLTGHATLIHELGRTWTASLGYNRGFRTQAGFDELYFTDAVVAHLGGLISRRLSFSATGSWAMSSVGDVDSKNQRDQSASAQLNYGLTRMLALYAQYNYYFYRYDESVALDNRFPRNLDRHGVRVGLTTSIPLLR